MSGNIFNDDLLANEGDKDLASRSYPRVCHVFDHPRLVAEFSESDALANSAKAKSRRRGLAAIVLATCALVIASIQPALHEVKSEAADMGEAHYSKGAVLRKSDHEERVSSAYAHSRRIDFVLGLGAASAGIISVVLGLGGVLYGGSKRRWLEQRLMTERLRQFHFQTIIARLQNTAGSLESEAKKQLYLIERDSWLDQFLLSYKGHEAAQLACVLDPAQSFVRWLHPRPRENASLAQQQLPLVEELLEGYRTLRIEHQYQYANYKLAKLEVQDAVIGRVGFICILTIVLIHLGFVYGLIFGGTVQMIAVNPVTHVVLVSTALLALGCRALEDGLGLRSEKERYRDYSALIGEVRVQFNAATEVSDKMRAMERMEEGVVDEMARFLKSMNAARYLM